MRHLGFLIIFFPLQLLAQADLTSLRGTFKGCSYTEFMDLHEGIRPRHFKCPEASGFVLQGTPVSKVTVVEHCSGKYRTKELLTPASCNTVGCVFEESMLKKFTGASMKCGYHIKKADLFEYYPIFSTSGPNRNTPFLESMPLNNEDDPNYLSRINGQFGTESRVRSPREVGTKVVKEDGKKVEIKSETREQICKLDSLEILPPNEQKDLIKIIELIYQNPDFPDDKLQRKSFCLLKRHYEAVNDYDSLLSLVSKMKFQQEFCE